MLPFTLYLLPYLNTRSHTQFSFRYNTACSRGEESTLEAAKANLEAQKKITAELQLEVAEALKRQAARVEYGEKKLGMAVQQRPARVLRPRLIEIDFA